MRTTVVCAVLLAASGVRAETRSVGPGKTYAKPCAAFAAAQDGDFIEIDASGSYDGDVCVITRNRLWITGKNGRARIDAAGKNAAGKAIWVIQGSDTIVSNVELSGCTVPDKNGAGIRQEGRNLTVEDSFFHDNENGILTGADAQSTILIQRTEFARNGAGDGQSHNMYIGEVGQFTLRESYSHHAKVGHLVKSRALRNDILYNRLTDETGTASYELDLPQGGASYVIGNVLQQSASSSNGGVISFAREGKRNASTALWVVNNTFVNARSAGTFVAVASDVSTVVLRNNIFVGNGTPTDFAGATSEGNFAGDAKLASDYTLMAGSPAIDTGVAPGSGGGQSLAPTCQPSVPARKRAAVGTIDVGALEYGDTSMGACTEDGVDPAKDAGVDAALPPVVPDARVPSEDARIEDVTDARAGGPVAPREDASASEPTKKSDDGCQGAGVGAQLWSAVVLALALRRRRYAVR